eukprot:g3979.t1
MSIVAVQLGQCGNQLGRAFFDCLAAEHVDASDPDSTAARMFFRPMGASGAAASSIARPNPPATAVKLIARAVLVDLEPRVVRDLLNNEDSSSASSSSSSSSSSSFSARRPRPYAYSRQSAFTKASGAGNNWVHGFAMGAEMRAELERVLQQEVDRCDDRLEAFLCFFSVAGGTGSGLGSYAMGVLKDLYPSVPILACCVLPFAEGEVAVQSFNACLSLHASYEHADLIFPFENKRSSTKSKNRVEEFAAMNRLIVDTLLHAAYSEKNARFSADSWSALAKRVAHVTAAKVVEDFYCAMPPVRNVCFSAEAVCRGAGDVEEVATVLAGELDFSNKALSTARNRLRVVEGVLSTADRGGARSGCSNTVSLATNCQTPVKCLDTYMHKAAALARTGCYMHYFDQDLLADAILGVRQIAEDYKVL